MKKRNIQRGLLVVLILLFSVVTSSASLGTLSCWYSGSSRIGRWSPYDLIDGNYMIIGYHCYGNDPLYYSRFETAIIDACSAWNTTLNIYVGCLEDEESLPFQVFGNLSSSFYHTYYYNGEDEQYYVEFVQGAAGRTVPCVLHTEGLWSYGNGYKFGDVYSVVVAAVRGSSYSQDEMTQILMHEIGHGLGWQGHSANASDVMYSSVTGETELSYRDKNHLSQVYPTY